MMRSFLKWTWIEIKLFCREPLAVFFSLLLPLLLFFLFGTLARVEYLNNMVPSLVGMIVATNGLITLPVQVATYREKQILRRFSATPMHPYIVLLGEMITMLAMTLLGFVLLLLVAKFGYDITVAGNIISLMGACCLSTIAFLSLGFIVGGLFTTARTTQIMGMVAFYPMLFLCGTTIPLEAIGEPVRSYIEFLPLTHVVTLHSGIWFGDSWNQHIKEICILLGTSGASFLISAKTFRWE